MSERSLVWGSAFLSEPSVFSPGPQDAQGSFLAGFRQWKRFTSVTLHVTLSPTPALRPAQAQKSGRHGSCQTLTGHGGGDGFPRLGSLPLRCA